MAARIESETEPGVPEKWQCGTEYKYPIDPDGDHWQKLLQPLLEQDRLQCEKWKDEVQSLLIFAGLFSAIVTAFVIVSYQSLQPDQNEMIVNLLARIAIHLDSSSNRTSSLSPESINPASLTDPIARSSIRINIFWFSSLVLSLTTALVSIVSLQWLREHQQYPDTLPSREKFALLGMRVEGLVAWYVPQIFSSLPLLLQSALILYFVGLIDFLLAASLTVAIPVIVFVGIPLAFLILTTTIPAFQILIFCLPLAGRALKVPPQAPFKSTQSRLFRQLLISSKPIFTLLAYITYITYHFLVLLPSRLYRYLKPRQGEDTPEADGIDLSAVDLQWSILLGSDVLGTSTFLSFDNEWLTLRNAYAKCIFDKKSWMSESFMIERLTRVPFYDLAQAMRNIVAPDTTLLPVAYHAVQEMTSCIIGSNFKSDPHRAIRVTYNLYLQKLLGLDNEEDLANPVPNFSSHLPWTDPSESFEFVEDENSFLFLSRYDHLPPSIFRHFAELHIRIANYLYPNEACRIVEDSSKFPTLPDLKLVYDWEETLSRESTSKFDESISQQFSSLVKTYLEVIANPSVNFDNLMTSLYGHKIGKIFEYAAIRQSTEDTLSTLTFLSTMMEDCLKGTLNQRSDFLFYISSFYARTLLVSDPRFRDYLKNYDQNTVVAPFLPLLHQYLDARGCPDADLRERLGIPDFPDEWWDFLNHTRGQPGEQGESKTLSYTSLGPNGNAIHHADPLPYKAIPEKPSDEHDQSDVFTTSSDAGNLV